MALSPAQPTSPDESVFQGVRKREMAMLAVHWPPMLSGVGDHAFGLAKALSASGWNVETTLLDDGPTPGLPAAESVRYARFPSGVANLVRSMLDLGAGRNRPLLIEFEAHAFHRMWMPHLLPLALRVRGWKVILVYHELWGPKRFTRIGKLLLLNAPHRVVVSTEWHAEGVARFRRLGRSPDIIPCPSNIGHHGEGDRRLLRLRYGIQLDDLILVFLGFVGPQHCVQEVLEGLATVGREFPQVKLSVIGHFDPTRNGYHQDLERSVRELGLTSRVTWHGRVEDEAAVSRLLTVADIGVVPYREGVGENNTAFAAMASHGLPIVTTCGPRAATMMRERVAEFVEPSAHGIATGILGLLKDGDRRAELAKSAPEWAAGRDWEVVAERFGAILGTA